LALSSDSSQLVGRPSQPSASFATSRTSDSSRSALVMSSVRRVPVFSTLAALRAFLGQSPPAASAIASSGS
jgi:hypothetical protein